MSAYTSPLPQPDITSDHSCPYVRVMFTQIVLLTTSTRSLVVSLKLDISLPHVMTELHDPLPHNTHAAEHALPNERAVECKGLQSIRVLNSQVCTDGSGNIIDPYHSPYIWLPQLVDDDLAFSVKFLKKQ